MSHYLIQQIEAIPGIEFHACTEAAAGDGGDHLERLTLRDILTGALTRGRHVVAVRLHRRRAADRLARRRPRPRRRGFIVTGPDLLVDGRRPPGWPLPRDPYHLETSVPGVFAAGDVRAESVKRVASAVGEGAMAVSLVHRYLEAQ